MPFPNWVLTRSTSLVAILKTEKQNNDVYVGVEVVVCVTVVVAVLEVDVVDVDVVLVVTVVVVVVVVLVVVVAVVVDTVRVTVVVLVSVVVVVVVVVGCPHMSLLKEPQVFSLMFQRRPGISWDTMGKAQGSRRDFGRGCKEVVVGSSGFIFTKSVSLLFCTSRCLSMQIGSRISPA